MECLGNCAKAPNVQVNDKLFDSLVPEEADKFIEKIKTLDAEGKLASEPTSAKPSGNGDFNSPAYKG